MEAACVLRTICEHGPPYSNNVPAPVQAFLNGLEEDEDAASSSSPAPVVADPDSPISLLDAFGIFPSRSPGSGAPQKEHLAYSLLRLSQVAAREAYRLETTEDEHDLLDEDSVAAHFMDVWNRYHDMCDVLWD
ncbi:hypothetical protein BD309DRAFT_820508, partial [Dichomitus squalens]